MTKKLHDVMEQRWVRYNPKLKQIARTLRKNMTPSEILLWKELKGKQLLGYDFHRQKPVGEYVVDYYCSSLKLVIEIDGDSHEGKEEADRIRQENLESLGLTVMRFWDSDVKRNIYGVVETLREWIVAHATHPPPAIVPQSEMRRGRPKSPLTKVRAMEEGTFATVGLKVTRNLCIINTRF